MAKGIRFNYLYRDSGNYKKFGHKDFSNPNNLTVDEITLRIRQSLIDTEFFYPEKACIRKFLFHRYCDDYSWYEFESIEEIESQYSLESIEELIAKLLRDGSNCSGDGQPCS